MARMPAAAIEPERSPQLLPRAVPRALRRGRLPDPFTMALYAASPYRGCGHACAYCDGRAEKYHVGGDFGRDVEYRGELPALLAAELAGVEDMGAVSLGSGVTDAYQGAEAELGLAGRAAGVIAAAGFPAVLITKSARVLRDLDTWAAIARRSGCLVMMTLTTMDEGIRAVFEPGASPVADRIEALRRLRAAGCMTGVLAMPMLPRIGDGEEAFAAILDAAAGAGASFVMPGGLTLRPGRQKDHFMGVLARFAPEHVAAYRDIYAEERQSGMPKADYYAPRDAAWKRMLAARELSALAPQAVHSRLLAPPDSLLVLLSHMATLYAARGVPTAGLRAATKRYGDWLAAIRTECRRRRRRAGPEPDLFCAPLPAAAEVGLGAADGRPSVLSATSVARRFRAAIHSGELEPVFANATLWTFVRDLVLGDRTFDYVRLRPVRGDT